MTYSEIIERLKSKRSVQASEVSGMQTFMLIYDGYIHSIRLHKNTLYELHMTPIENDNHFALIINDKSCPNYTNAISLIENFLCNDKSKDMFISLNDELFQIGYDILED